MKYLLLAMGLVFASAPVWGASASGNNAFDRAAVITVEPSSDAGGMSAGLLVSDVTYRISSVGTTDFTAVGADANLVGTVFTATGAAAGTGMANSVATFVGSNVGATSETGEPVHAVHGSGNSVWWVWTPTTAGTATIDTEGSLFDTVLAVYTGGDTLQTLSSVAYSDDSSTNNTSSKVTFSVRAGTTYYIAVDGYNGGAQAPYGTIKLHVALGTGTYLAQNDNYADRALLAGESTMAYGDSLWATVETGEDMLAYSYDPIFGYYYYFGTMGTKSVWWTWTAPRAGQVTITNQMDINPEFAGDYLYAELALFNGSPATIDGGLTMLSWDESPSFSPSETATLTRTVQAGEVLQIRASSWDAYSGARITLKVEMSATTGSLINDRFVKRTIIQGSNAFATVNNGSATSDPGEPAHYAQVTAGALVAGQLYMINSKGTTDFTTVGATSNTLGTEFTATGVGEMTAGTFVIGQSYIISSAGTTNFMAIGALANTAGTQFTATAVGAGTGTAIRTGLGSGTALLLRPAVVDKPVTYNAGQFVVGSRYRITTVGSTDFTAIGALANEVGRTFTATGAGTGTGKAVLISPGLLIVGKSYRIESIGTTDFTNIGAAANTVGLTFTATGKGDGDGTVLPVEIIEAGSFVAGRNYRIESIGTTNFMDIGAAANVVGTDFQATGVGSGTGTASTPSASKSVWWTWFAPSNGYATIDTKGSLANSGAKLDTLINIYTGKKLSTLISMASNDDVDATDPTSSVHFQVVKGTSYQIAVDCGADNRAAGDIDLNIAFTPDIPIITTQVQNQTAYLLPLSKATFTVFNTGAAAVYDWQRKQAGKTTWVHYSDGVTTSPVLANEVATSTLTVPSSPAGNVTADMNGDQFRCIITNVAGQIVSQSATLTVVSVSTYVNGFQSIDISPVSPPALGVTTTYYARGLPAGLVINKNTGEITGRLTAKPGTYTITFWAVTVNTATGKKTQTPTSTVSIYVLPFPAAMTGAYEGLFGDAVTPSVPVGKVELLVNNVGSFTGKLTYQGKAYAINRAALTLDNAFTPTKGKATLNLSSAFSLDITVTNASTMTATLTSPGGVLGDLGNVTDGVLLRTYTVATPAPWAGSYTMAFTNPTTAGPEGSGYALVTIKGNGLLTLKGKLADGTLVSSSLQTDAGAYGTYRQYLPLYAKGLGSLSGKLQLSPRGVNTGLYHVATPVVPDFYWSKPTSAKDKAYPGGFGPVGLDVVMEPWITSTNSYLIGVLGLLTPSDSQMIGDFTLMLDQVPGVSNSAPNVDMLPIALKMNALSKVSALPPIIEAGSFVTGRNYRIESIGTTDFTTIGAVSNTVGLTFTATGTGTGDGTVFPVDPNPSKCMVTIAPKTGVFTGSFILQDKRKVSLEGVLLQLPSGTLSNQFGRGFFLVPPDKTIPGSTILSGDVIFTGLLPIP